MQKYGSHEPITRPDDNSSDEIRKEATPAWTPEDSAELARENATSSSEEPGLF